MPDVTSKLEELRSPELHALFSKHDVHSQGRVNEATCLKALEAHAKSETDDEKELKLFWEAFKKDFTALYDELSQGDDRTVDFKTFQILVGQFNTRKADYHCQLERRIAVVEMLPPEMEAKHTGELSWMKRFFDEGLTDNGPENSIALRDVLDGILQCGVAPPAGHLWTRLLQIMESCNGIWYGFKEYLQVVDTVREDGLNTLILAIKALFESYEWAVAPQIRSGDVPGLILELELCTDVCGDPDRLPTLVEACDEDDTGDLNMQQLAKLCLKVCEKARAAQREKETHLANKLGFSKKQVLQMRETYAILTSSTDGVLRIPELVSWFKEINPDLKPSMKDIEAIVAEACPAPKSDIFSETTDDGADSPKPDLTEDLKAIG